MPAGEPNRVRMAGGLLPSVQDDRLRKHFRDLLELTGLVCESPDGVIHLFDEMHEGYTAFTKDRAVALPLDACFCSHSNGQEGLVVPDLREDPRFRDHILVTREPCMRFYAGYPLITDRDERLGSLCLREPAPRQLTPVQQRGLVELARHVVAHIEAMRQLIGLEAALQEKDGKLRDFAASNARFRAFLDASPVSAFIKDEEGRMLLQ
jgi:GAF domain-containing protein